MEEGREQSERGVCTRARRVRGTGVKRSSPGRVSRVDAMLVNLIDHDGKTVIKWSPPWGSTFLHF